MNKLIPTLTLSVLLLGCKVFGNAMINTAAGLAGIASQWAVIQWPEKRPQFQAAKDALTIWLETGSADGVPLDVDAIIRLLTDLGLDQDGWGDKGQLYFDGALVVWNLAKPINYVITSQEAVQKIGTAIRDGFGRGLAKLKPTEAITRAASLPAKRGPVLRAVIQRSGARVKI